MTDLTTRLAQADKPTRELLAEVYRAIYPPLRSKDHSVEECDAADLRAFVYFRMLDAEAWTSAVEMLKGPGWFTSDHHAGPTGGNWWELSRIRDGEQQYTSVMGSGACPALALAIACLKARGL